MEEEALMEPEVDSRKAQSIVLIKRWILDEFFKQGMTHDSIIAEKECWFVPKKLETPQGPERGPFLYNILKRLQEKNEQVTVGNYAEELSGILKNLEINTKEFMEQKKELEESIRKIYEDVEVDYRNFVTNYKGLVPSKSKAIIYPIALAYSERGIYHLEMNVEGKGKYAAKNVRILRPHVEVKIDSAMKFECPLSKVDQAVEIYIRDAREQQITGGTLPLLQEFLALRYNPEKPEEMFEPQKLEIRITKTEEEEDARITLMMQLFLDENLFDKALAHFKAQYDFDLHKCERALAKLKKIIVQILEAFPNIQFDPVSGCFFSGEEEKLVWEKSAGRKNVKHEDYVAPEPDAKPRSCGCCTIF